jgi:Phage Tail Collar Domain
MPDVTAISVPIGTVISYVGRLETVNQLASEGWLLCDGRSIPSTQYPELLRQL